MMMRCQTQNLRGFLRTEGEFPNAILNGNTLKLPVAPQSTTFVTWRDRKLNTSRKPEVQQGVNL